MRATLIQTDDVPYVWHDIVPMLNRAIDRADGEMTSDDFLGFCSDGQMQLWIITEDNAPIMSAITQFIEYPQKKILRFIIVAGERFEEVREAFNDMFEGFAIHNGCTAMELWGRKGWKKMLSDWNETYTVFTKDLKERMH